MLAHPSRRAVLATGGALFASAYLPAFAAAPGARDARFVVINLRGGLDALSTVAPLGDPRYAELRGPLALEAGGANPALPLDGFFALNPSMPTFARLYRAGQGAIVHAVATPYRERSHFDAQDVLESGLPRPVSNARDGWLNRAIAAIPAGARVAARGGLAIGATTPLILRGPAPVIGWAPQILPNASDDLAMRVLDLYRHADPALAQALARGLETERIASRMGMQGGDMNKPRGGLESIPGMRQAAQGAARLIAADDGPRIAALSFTGWDTHANEGPLDGRLSNLLKGLDGAIEEFESGLGPLWKDTALLIVTEFGRTARVNGTIGTDHGTATLAFLAGGAVKGGRVIADWPGLADGQLHEGRDLRPTTDLRAIAKGLLAELFGVAAAALDRDVFPDSAAAPAMKGLIA